MLKLLSQYVINTIFILGIDDSETECNLDDVTDWDLEINNNGEDIESILQKIIDILK